MSVSAFEAKFHALSHFSTQLLGTEKEIIRLYVKGLRNELQVLFMHMTSGGKSFNEVTDYVKKLKGSDMLGKLRCFSINPRVWVILVDLILES